MMKTVCVFCGANAGANPAYAEAARAFGTLLAKSGRRLVTGGGRVGLMGIVADAALAAGGEAVGVIPTSLLEKEVQHKGLTELHVVDTMHERKALMAELSDGFVALPGGIGTLEEFFEVWTWAQIGLHGKPYGLYDAAGFYSPLFAFLQKVVDDKFLRPEHLGMVYIEPEGTRLLERMDTHRPVVVSKWIDEVVKKAL
jgi:uncharacterized protein (TIGR00730 family)